MPAHGIPNFPDPPSNGPRQINLNGFDINSPQFQAARKDCSRYNPLGGA